MRFATYRHDGTVAAGVVSPDGRLHPYFTNPHTLIGAFDPVTLPPGCAELDHELEVAVVIGPGGADLTPEQARDHIVGYPVFNDWSARDLQGAEMRVGLGPAKGKAPSARGFWGVRGDLLPPPLAPGDVVTLTVEGIGSVTNTITETRPAAAALPPTRPARPRPRLRTRTP